MPDREASPRVVRCSPVQAAKTYDRLSRFVRFDANPKHCLSAVFARCCLATHPDFGLDPAAVAAEAASVARAALDHPHSERLDLDPLLLVSCLALLTDEGLDSAPLHDLVVKIAEGIAKLDEKTRRMGRVRHIASRLAARGLEATVEPPGKEVRQLTRAPGKVLNAPSEVLADLADHLFADRTELDEDLNVLLALVALGELRNYRVDLGAKLLRLVVTQGRRCEEAAEGLNFVALQRRRDGAYGFLNPLLKEEERHDDPEASFFLPMTLHAVWLFRSEAVRRLSSQEAEA